MTERVEAILRQLEEAREGLLGYADDVWLGIDHRDAAKLTSGVAFIESLHQKITDLGKLTDELSEMVRQYTHAEPREQAQVIDADLSRNERIIRELDRATPHTLDESFTWKRPYGFVLGQQAVTDVATWRDLYRGLCQILAERDLAKFNALPENDEFLSAHGHRDFTRGKSGLREPYAIANGIFAEVHYSANDIRDNMRRLLRVFGYQPGDMRIYLRQDRDAGGDSVA